MGVQAQPSNQPHSLTCVGTGEAGVDAGPESHGRGVDGFVGAAVGGDVIKNAVGRD